MVIKFTYNKFIIFSTHQMLVELVIVFQIFILYFKALYHVKDLHYITYILS